MLVTQFSLFSHFIYDGFLSPSHSPSLSFSLHLDFHLALIQNKVHFVGSILHTWFG